MEHRDWLKIENWLDLANREPAQELAWINFGIRKYRSMGAEDIQGLLEQVRQILEAVVSRPRPGGIEHFEVNPFRLFMYVLETAELFRLRRCPVCEKYFYARRKDQIACTRPCANVERQRRFRQRRPTYEENRKRNRAAKKAREQVRLK